MRNATIVVLVVLILGGAYFFLRDTEPNISDDTTPRATSTAGVVVGERVEVIAEDLEIPWDIEFLPSGDLLVTERPGRLVRIEMNGEKHSVSIPLDVEHRGEGGLLGIALHPDFETNNFVYLYRTEESGGGTINRVSRFVFENDAFTDETIIIDDIPGAIYHDGGQLAFGPDGYLYITTGDATKEHLAQDLNSLAGKILRLTDSGGIPSDNPFGTAVYSYGHRNPQGLAWVGKKLWSTEHGRSGILSGLDELNLIEKGKNYGWPTIEGDESNIDMEGPARHSGANETWAPASLARFEYKDGSVSLFWSGLKGESLYEATLSESGAIEGLQRHLEGEYGRLRAAAVDPDGLLYITTSNKDGRGNVDAGDDKVIRINPELL